MKNDWTNEVVGTYKGPGVTGEEFVIQLTKEVVAEYLTFQLKMKTHLQIQGIKLNETPKHSKCKINVFSLMALNSENLLSLVLYSERSVRLFVRRPKFAHI